jgi:uncharacterized membrane protein YkoI
MKVHLIAVLAILFLVFTAQACKDNSTDPSNTLQSEQSLVKKSTSMSGGTFIESGKFDDGSPKFEVKIDMPGDGGIVKFEYQMSNGEIREIQGLTPSFDYEIVPEMGLINYSAARSIALIAKSGTVTFWKLQKDESDNMWQYRFDIHSGRTDWEVRISASNGNVLRVKS